MGCAGLPLAAVCAETPFPQNNAPEIRDIGPDCRSTWSAKPSGPMVVMLISPRMVYSMLEWPRMRTAALAAGFEVVTWKAPGVSLQEWAQAVGAARWTPAQNDLISDAPPGCAAWLQNLNHFPFSAVVMNGQVHGWPIWGVLPDEAWVASLALRLASLRGASHSSKVNSP